jgi:hypothetical protein
VAWRERAGALSTALDRGWAVWTGLGVGAAVGVGTAMLADLPAPPLAVGGALAGGLVLFVGDRFDDEG